MSTLKRLILISIILIAIGVIGSLFTVKTLFKSNELITEEQTVDGSYDDVHINVENLSVKLYTSNDNETKIVTSSSKGSNTTANISNGVLEITVDEQNFSNFTFSSFNFWKSIPTLKVYLPNKVYETVNVKSKNGMIKVDDLKLVELSLNTINGLIEINDVESDVTQVNTENGMVTLSDVSGDIIGRTTNGKMTVETSQLDQNIDLKTVNGLISVETLDAPTNVTFDLNVQLGKIDLFGDNSQNAIYGDGEHLVKLRTETGKITVNRK